MHNSEAKYLAARTAGNVQWQQRKKGTENGVVFVELKPVRRVKLSVQIEQQLQQQILDGKWKAGDRLPSENDLCATFHVSRVTIRQALQSMATKGLIETRGGDGSFVAQPAMSDFVARAIPEVYLSEDPLRTVMEFRLLFEAPVAELAARRAEDEQLRQMRVLYGRMTAIGAADLREHSDLDYEMHELIGSMTHNPMVEGIYRVQNNILRGCWHSISTTIGADRGVYYHGKLLTAFQARDAALCRAVMAEHVADTWELIYGKKPDLGRN